jgi:hypothetical protein
MGTNMMMAEDMTDGTVTRRWSEMKRLLVTKSRARRFVITLRLKPNKTAKKSTRESATIAQPLLPRWEEKRFEVAILSSGR